MRRPRRDHARGRGVLPLRLRRSVRSRPRRDDPRGHDDRTAGDDRSTADGHNVRWIQHGPRPMAHGARHTAQDAGFGHWLCALEVGTTWKLEVADVVAHSSTAGRTCRHLRPHLSQSRCAMIRCARWSCLRADCTSSLPPHRRRHPRSIRLDALPRKAARGHRRPSDDRARVPARGRARDRSSRVIVATDDLRIATRSRRVRRRSAA